MIDFSTQLRDYAGFLPAVSKIYADLAIGPLLRKAPVDGTDLDFLNSNSPLFHYPFALYSAGQANLNPKTPNIISKRNRAETVVLGDSGGFQIIKGDLKINGKTGPELGDKERKIIVDWLEGLCDWAMTIDVPSGALGFEKSKYTHFRETISDTVKHLLFIIKNRGGKTKYLSCLHGRNKAECDLWFNAVRQFEFEGWAFASGYKNDYFLILHRLLKMRDEKYLEKSERLHFLGQSNLAASCLLTVLQRALRQINLKLEVTFDAASAFISIGNGGVYTGHSLTPKSFGLQTARMPDNEAYIGSDRPFPWRSPIGERLSFRDICVCPPRVSGNNGRLTTWDTTSYELLMNHNLFVQIEAIIAANKIFDLELADAREFCPANLLEIREIISKAFEEENWASFIEEHERPLRFYRETPFRKQYDGMDKSKLGKDLNEIHEASEFEDRLNAVGDF